MIQKVGAALPFAAHFVASKVGKAGITVTVDVFKKPIGGVKSQVITDAAATEVGDGVYTYEFAAVNVDVIGSYWAVFKTSDVTVDAQQIASAWLTPIWLGTLGAATVVLVSPVATDGATVTLVRGDDHFAADGRSLDFNIQNSPSLIGGTVKLTLKRSGVTDLTMAGAVLSATLARFEPDKTLTAKLVPGVFNYNFDVEATLANGHVVTPVIGKASVLEDVS